MSHCPNHPEIELQEKLTCPLCAQEARRKAYQKQQTEMARQMQWAVQGLLKPPKEIP